DINRHLYNMDIDLDAGALPVALQDLHQIRGNRGRVQRRALRVELAWIPCILQQLFGFGQVIGIRFEAGVKPPGLLAEEPEAAWFGQSLVERVGDLLAVDGV